MGTTRIFVSHSSPAEAQQDDKLLQQFITDLQAAGIDIVTDNNDRTAESFVAFLTEELSTCQWLILFQTPEVLSAQNAQVAVKTALDLVKQGRLQGVLRFIVTPSPPQTLPPAWQETSAFDATHDYARARERLLLLVSMTNLSPAAPSSTLAPEPQALSASTSSTYDRPTAPPARKRTFKISMGRRTLLTMLAALLSAAIVISGTAFLFTYRSVGANGKPHTIAKATSMPTKIPTSTPRATPTPKPTPKPTPTPTSTPIPALMPTVAPTPTPTPVPTPLEELHTIEAGTPVYQDALDNAQNGSTVAKKWDQNSHCAFTNDGYRVVTAATGERQDFCHEEGTAYANGVIRVTMMINAGFSGALLFRDQSINVVNGAYAFQVTSDGRYKVFYIPRTGSYVTIQDFTSSSAIHPGEPIVLEVMMQGSNLSFFVNGTFLFQKPDTTYIAGSVTVADFEAPNESGNVTFSNMTIWNSND